MHISRFILKKDLPISSRMRGQLQMSCEPRMLSVWAVTGLVLAFIKSVFYIFFNYSWIHYHEIIL